jgi:flagellar assembly protein FliH
MTTSSPDRGRVLRGAAAATAPSACLDTTLSERSGGVEVGADLRLLDPAVGRAMDELADVVRRAARSEGYAAGWAEGRRAAAARAVEDAEAADRDRRAEAARTAAALRAALTALAAAAEELERRTAPVVTELADAVLETALALAEALLGRELDLSATPAMDAVRRALALAPTDRPVTVRLHPQDAATVAGVLAHTPLPRPVTVVPDAEVERHGAVVACDATLIDAQLGPALARVREVLAG